MDCEDCTEYVNADDIDHCDECGLYLCEKCALKHELDGCGEN